MNRLENPEGSFESDYRDTVDLMGALCGSFPGDPALLGELGIDLSLIRMESLLPLKVFKRPVALDSNPTDIIGPILFLTVFAVLLILRGKLHFEYIYLISISSCSLLYLLLNLISFKDIHLTACCSILGYSLGPVVLYSLLSPALCWSALTVRVALGLVAAAWSAYTASTVLCRCLNLANKMCVVGFPLLLTYVCFVLMVLF